MSAKTDSTSAVEPQSNKVSGVMASPAPNSGQKLSNFATKSGFVIPKNKLSGSLVPIFRGAKKDGVGGGTTESNSKQMQRKTKWGPDLTQDVAVRKGRALALQIRVDQITQQLKSGKLSTGNTQDSPLVDENPDPRCSIPQIDIKSESLQLEMREAIGEILKLDPSYQPPPGFKPLLKEASVPLPVKEYPGYNFICLIYGPEGDNQKRLEKETGARVQVQGTKADTGEKVEIKPGNSLQCTYENMHVLVSADTFEKVDAAVSIIELLLTSVTGNLAAASTPHTSVSGGNADVLSQNQVGMPSNAISVATENQAMQPVAGATQMPGHQLQYSGPWFSTAPSHTPVFASSGNIAHPNPSSLTRPLHFAQQTMNTPNVTLNFGARPAPVVGFNPIIPNRPIVSPQAQPPRQILQHSQLTPLGHIGPPIHPSIVSVQASSAETTASLPFPVTVSQPAAIGQLQTQVPISPSSIPDRPLTSLGVSSGQGGASVGGTISFSVSNMGPMAPAVTPPPRPVSLHPQPDMAFKPPPSNISLTPFPPHQSGIPPGPMQPVPATNTNSSIHSLSGSSSFPSPGLSTSLPIPSSASGLTPYHTPVRPPVLTASGSGNFTFQLQQPNTNFQGVSRPNSQAAPQGGIQQQLSGPRPPSLPFAVPERPVNQIFPRQQVLNPVDQPHAHASSFPFGGRPGAISTPPMHTAFPYAGQPAPRSRNFMPAPQMPNLPSPQFPRAGSIHVRQNYPPHKLLPDITLPSNQKFGNNQPMAPGKPAYPADQIYDPFSPTSIQPPQHKSGPMK
ncbi:hypothetical protein L6164_012478 [Bauhinia variegata]|uniref:Uncharacterized protein n=1 Tax=Bauhinia variegata TaxID=167791 RepID=A0ACB9PBE2_BAUVA|nr:hypothetical protein L6164_012478 [Bauhinia variegata]